MMGLEHHFSFMKGYQLQALNFTQKLNLKFFTKVYKKCSY